MTLNGRPETAKIYQFPIKPRRGIDARRSNQGQMGSNAPRAVFETGTAWYHDDAIAAAKPDCPHAG